MQHGDVGGSDQRGSTLVLVTVSMVALFGFTALTMDVARAYKEKRHEQFGTDAGAFAAVVMLTNATAGTAETNAIQEATNVADANGVTASEIMSGGGVQVGRWANSQFYANQTSNGVYTAVNVPAKRNVSMLFAKVVGLSSMNPRAHSIADLESAGRAANIVPFGVSEAQFTNKNFGDTMDFNDPTVGPGKWGKLDLGVYEAPDYSGYKNTAAWQNDMTTSGCNCTVSVGTIPTIQGTAQVDQTFNGLASGTILTIPVAAQIDTSGNKPADIVGFVVVQLISSGGNGANWTATVKFLDEVTGDAGGGTCPPPCVQARVLVQ